MFESKMCADGVGTKGAGRGVDGVSGGAESGSGLVLDECDWEGACFFMRFPDKNPTLPLSPADRTFD